MKPKNNDKVFTHDSPAVGVVYNPIYNQVSWMDFLLFLPGVTSLVLVLVFNLFSLDSIKIKMLQRSPDVHIIIDYF